MSVATWSPLTSLTHLHTQGSTNKAFFFVCLMYSQAKKKKDLLWFEVVCGQFQFIMQISIAAIVLTSHRDCWINHLLLCPLHFLDACFASAVSQHKETHAETLICYYTHNMHTQTSAELLPPPLPCPSYWRRPVEEERAIKQSKQVAMSMSLKREQIQLSLSGLLLLSVTWQTYTDVLGFWNWPVLCEKSWEVIKLSEFSLQLFCCWQFPSFSAVREIMFAFLFLCLFKKVKWFIV